MKDLLIRSIFVLMCGVVLLGAQVTYAEEKEGTPLSSEITAVTVFSDRAQVTRSAKTTLAKGSHLLAFTGLPESIDQNSLQVDGTGSLVLHDIRFIRKHLSETADENLKKIEEEQLILEDSLRVIDDRIAHAGNEKDFVQKIADGLTKTDAKEVPIELDPAKWARMVEFYRGKIETLNKQVRAAEKNKRDLKNELNRVGREISELGPNSRKMLNTVQVQVDMKKQGEVNLDLSYIITGPAWKPIYDVRVSSANKKVSIMYKARIWQNTSEDWNKVIVTLSTAQPSIGGKHPELKPMYLSYYQAPERRSRGNYYETAAKKKEMPQMMKNTISSSADELKKYQWKKKPIERALSQVRTHTTAVVFVPEGKTTIKSDNQPHTVTIMSSEFPSSFRYSIVPKHSQHAYLKAKVKNTTDYPFLPGRTNIFLDNSFVAASKMELVAPSEEFWTFLGVDDGISVEYKRLRRYEKSEGLNKKTRMIYEYETVLKNKKRTKEEIVLWNQLPISNNQGIIVELIKPKYKEDTKTLKKNELDFFEWYFKLKPDEEVKIPFSYSVKYPRGKRITGLE